VVSKKVIKSAVKRNRLRRRLYETIRLELPSLVPQTDLVYIVISPEVLLIPTQELTDNIQRTLQASALYKTADK